MTTYTPAETIAKSAVTKTKGNHRVRNQSLFMLVVGVGLSLFTYQYYHNGLWGQLVNYNKLPLLKLQGTTVTEKQLNLTLYRPNGPDTYGSFVEKVTVSVPGQAKPVETWTPAMLAKVASNNIENAYKFQRVQTGPWGLVVPLAAKATVKLPLTAQARTAVQQAGQAKILVEDVSGVKWTWMAPVK